MRRFPVLCKTIRDYRVQAVWMSVVAALVGVLDVSIYPSYRDSLAGFEKNLPGIIESMAGAAGSITSPAGFLNAEWFSWIPLLFIALAIIAGTGATAGEEAAGTLDLLLAQPRSRRRILLEKAGGAALLLTVAAIVSSIGFVVSAPFVELHLSTWQLIQATIFIVPQILLFGALALCAGVILPSRTSAAMAVTGLVVIAYVIQMVQTQVSALHGLRFLSPFYWSDASHVLIYGFAWARFGVLLGIAAAVTALAVWSFEERDIAAGRQEWTAMGLLQRLRQREEPTTPETEPSHGETGYSSSPKRSRRT